MSITEEMKRLITAAGETPKGDTIAPLVGQFSGVSGGGGGGTVEEIIYDNNDPQATVWHCNKTFEEINEILSDPTKRYIAYFDPSTPGHDVPNKVYLTLNSFVSISDGKYYGDLQWTGIGQINPSVNRDSNSKIGKFYIRHHYASYDEGSSWDETIDSNASYELFVDTYPSDVVFVPITENNRGLTAGTLVTGWGDTLHEVTPPGDWAVGMIKRVGVQAYEIQIRGDMVLNNYTTDETDPYLGRNQMIVGEDRKILFGDGNPIILKSVDPITKVASVYFL